MRAFLSLRILMLLCIFGLALQGCGGGGSGGSEAEVVSPPVVNNSPVANSGTDQSVTTGTVVTLDGSASSDANADPLTYSWSFTSKPAASSVVLSSSTASKPTFTADVAGTYVLSLVVNDGKVNSSADTVTITAISSGINVDVSAAGSADASASNYTFNFLEGTYTYNIQNFAPGDKMKFPSVLNLTVMNSFFDNTVTLQGGYNDYHVEVVLTLADMAYDAQLTSVSAFNTVFGAGTIQ